MKWNVSMYPKLEFYVDVLMVLRIRHNEMLRTSNHLSYESP